MPGAPTPLQRELKQNRPFRSPSEEALIGLMRTADLLRRSMSEVVGEESVTLQQYNVLRILRGAGDAGLPTLEIAHRMVEQTPGITRLLDRLEAKELVARERCPRDRRQVTCRISAAGMRLLASLDEPLLAVVEASLAVLSREEKKRLIEILDSIRAAPERTARAAS